MKTIFYILIMLTMVQAKIVRYQASITEIINMTDKRISYSPGTWVAPPDDTILLLINDRDAYENQMGPRAVPFSVQNCGTYNWIYLQNNPDGVIGAMELAATQGWICPENALVEINFAYHDNMARFYIPPKNAPTRTYVMGNPFSGEVINNTNISHQFSVRALTNKNQPISITDALAFNMWLARLNGPAGAEACEVPNESVCNQCAWPYYAYPDTSACGCKVLTNAYQSRNQLTGQCNAYCNSTSINGNQSYTDWSRSNFDATKGTITCACSDPTTRQTVYKPTQTCPTGTSGDQAVDLPDDTLVTDSSLQKVPFDPTTNPNLAGGGAGNGTGKYDSSILDRLTSIDTILGNALDTNGAGEIIDSINGKGNWRTDSIIGHDTSDIRGQIGQIQGDTSNTREWFGGTPRYYRGMDCWTCDTVPDTSITLDFNTFGINIKDTLKIGIAPVMTGLGFNFWPWMRGLEYLCTILAMIPLCMFIAGGTTGKDAV